MNTAGADVKSGTTVVGPARAGAGRVQADLALWSHPPSRT